jgi:hypothetical protein
LQHASLGRQDALELGTSSQRIQIGGKMLMPGDTVIR